MSVSLAEALIVDSTGHGVASRAAITVRDNALTMRDQGAVTERTDVVSVTPMGPGVWRVEFEDHSWWTITRKTRGCGCGR